MNTLNECTIILDGIDRAGKSTTLRYLVSQSKGKALVIDRGELSQIIYSRIYDRVIDEQYFKNQIIENSRRNYHYFVLIANNEVIKNRCLMTKEVHLSISKITHHRKQFTKLISELESKVKIHLIDTSYDSPAKISRKILKIIQEKLQVKKNKHTEILSCGCEVLKGWR